MFYAILSLLKLYSYLRNSVPNDSNINNKMTYLPRQEERPLKSILLDHQFQWGGESDDDDNGKMQSTHWCVLTPNMITRNSQINFQGNNMGHMGESLLPCWSLLFELGAMQQQQHGVRGKAAHTNNDSSFGCGIDTSALGPLRGWSKALVVEAMKCKIYDGRTANETKPNDQLHHPNLYLMSPYYRHMQYISHPSHAHLLRQNLVSDAYISNHKSYDGSERPLQIGLLERKKSRVILNLHDIAAGLSNAMPDTNLTITNFDHGPMIREQAEWWSTKDVIIAAHGSGVMNSVFITPKTIVLQIYPRECSIWCQPCLFFHMNYLTKTAFGRVSSSAHSWVVLAHD